MGEPVADTETVAKAAAEANEARLRQTARLMARHILASYALLGVSSSFMLTVAAEMALDCLSDLAARDKSQAEQAINAIAHELVRAMDELQGAEQEQAGANGTQAN